jgi:galactitol-specific phosphotransferase system IIB component
MKTITYKSKTKLIEKILEDENIKELSKSSVFGKILKKKENADVYFYSGSFDKEVQENIQNAKKVIVNSERVKKALSEFEEKIEVVYPSIDIKYDDIDKIRNEVYSQLDIEVNKKTIFFTAKNFKTSGVYDFLNIINYLNYKDFVVIIAGDKKEIANLRFKISRMEVNEKLILLDDFKDMDKLFIASDIFLLPTTNKTFNTNILKAMYCKCAVFTTIINDASELVDVFSTMESPQDRSMQFKLDALLHNKDELETIKQQNYDVAKEYTLEKQLKKIRRIIHI